MRTQVSLSRVKPGLLLLLQVPTSFNFLSPHLSFRVSEVFLSVCSTFFFSLFVLGLQEGFSPYFCNAPIHIPLLLIIQCLLVCGTEWHFLLLWLSLNLRQAQCPWVSQMLQPVSASASPPGCSSGLIMYLCSCGRNKRCLFVWLLVYSNPPTAMGFHQWVLLFSLYCRCLFRRDHFRCLFFKERESGWSIVLFL